MEKSIDLLVGDPFRRIVSLGTAAVENAGLAGDESMLQAAQGLVKEGERALKKLEELCQRYSGQFGASFTDAVNNNGRRTHFSTQNVASILTSVHR